MVIHGNSYLVMYLKLNPPFFFRWVFGVILIVALKFGQSSSWKGDYCPKVDMEDKKLASSSNIVQFQ